MGYLIVKPILDYYIRKLCNHPYPGHSHGCPNYGERSTCPPKALLFHEIIDLDQPIYAIWNVFDLGSHIQRMKTLHPEWSKRQLECCLYWQSRARKELDKKVIELIEHIIYAGGHWRDYRLIKCPEACGVNVTETMRNIGEELEWPPRIKTYQVAIAGWRK
jgi:hypothetical protein